MKTKIRNFIPLLEMLQALSAKERNAYIKSSDNQLVKFLSDLLYNINRGGISIDSDTINKLKVYKKDIKTISRKKTALKNRKKILQKKGFYQAVIGQLIPILIEIVKQ